MKSRVSVCFKSGAAGIDSSNSLLRLTRLDDSSESATLATKPRLAYFEQVESPETVNWQYGRRD